MFSPVDRLILDIAVGARTPTGEDIAAIRRHVAAAEFDPHSRLLAGRRVLGLPWSGGAAVMAGDRIPAAELHFLRHVVVQA